MSSNRQNSGYNSRNYGDQNGQRRNGIVDVNTNDERRIRNEIANFAQRRNIPLHDAARYLGYSSLIASGLLERAHHEAEYRAGRGPKPKDLTIWRGMKGGAAAVGAVKLGDYATKQFSGRPDEQEDKPSSGWLLGGLGLLAAALVL